MNEIKENILFLKEKVLKACVKANRSPEEVRILLATKTVSLDRIAMALENDMNIVGENKVQEFLSKYEGFISLPHPPEMHFIGHLQTNKVKDICNKIDLLHSLDRVSLLKELDKRLQKKLNVLVQVNTSNEASKYGLHPDEVLSFMKEALTYKSIEIKGFMTLAELANDKEVSRRCFSKLRSIKEKAENSFGLKFPELSMGMSSDFEVAIEEGATMIRVGTSVFGQRQYPDSYYWPS